MKTKKRHLSYTRRGDEPDLTAPVFGTQLTHAGCLDRLTLAALSRGDVDKAFRYTDRRCRIAPPPSAYHYVLRAEALIQKSETAAALTSLAQALALAPEDLQANRRMLTWGRGEPQAAAARVLCAHDEHPSVLLEAAKVLKRSGCRAIGSVKVFDTYIRGWAAWTTKEKPEIVIFGDDFEEHIMLAADSHHGLRKSGFEHYALFTWPRNPAQILYALHLRCGDEIILTYRISSKNEPLAKNTKALRKGQQPLTVIVPVYRDFAATKACLASLKREIDSLRDCKVIIVNDASPEPEIAPYLGRVTKRLGAMLLTNAHNMGFVGAVNRALALVSTGDIVLLNSDTLLPGDAIRRLVKTARANSSIGTITPLSNNGEFTSFPRAARAHPMLTKKDLVALNRVAARVNKNRIVDIPSGIGFCLFISAACFKAVCRLSESFQTGYLEDVDYCLRARENGFRNVCDTSVFVAHAGTRSFLADKRNLVMRNLPIIEERFPYDQAETRAFLALDPLRQARASIERTMTANSIFDILIVTGWGLVRSIAMARAKSLRQRGLRVWLAIVEADNKVCFVNTADAMPQSLAFRFLEENEYADLETYLHGLKIGRVELTDPVGMPMSLLMLLRKRSQPIDLFISDARWIDRGYSKSEEMIGEVAQIIVPCKQAKGFFQHYFPKQKTPVIVEDLAIVSSPSLKRNRNAAVETALNCGIITYGRSPDDFVLIKDLASKFRTKIKNSSLIVLGETFNDLGLMELDTVFVTAALVPGEVASICKLYGIRKLLALTRKPVFGYPLALEARATNLPLGYFDWSFGSVVPARRDLALHPDLDVSAIASRLATWMALPR